MSSLNGDRAMTITISSEDPRWQPDGLFWRRLSVRFWTQVRADPLGCWLWTGYKATDGYGGTSVRGKPRHAHQVAYELSTGIKPPTGAQVCHTCDVRLC